MALDKESNLVVGGDDRERFTTCFLCATLPPIQGSGAHQEAQQDDKRQRRDVGYDAVFLEKESSFANSFGMAYIGMPNGRGLLCKILLTEHFRSSSVSTTDTRTCLVRGKPEKAKLGVELRFVCTGPNSKLVYDTPSGWLCCFGLPSPEIPTRSN